MASGDSGRLHTRLHKLQMYMIFQNVDLMSFEHHKLGDYNIAHVTNFIDHLNNILLSEPQGGGAECGILSFSDMFWKYVENLSKIYRKIKFQKISFVHNNCLAWRILVKLHTEPDSMTAMLTEKCWWNMFTLLDVMGFRNCHI